MQRSCFRKHPKIVQDLLVQSSIQMTLDKYRYNTKNIQQAAKNFENAIKSGGNT